MQIAQADLFDNGRPRWRIDGGGSYSNFDSDALEEWGQQFARVEHRRGNVAYALGADNYQRFGAHDTQINAAISNARRGGIDWGLVASTTPSADFRPKTSIGGHVGGTINVSDSIKTYAAVRYRQDHFSDTTVHSSQPEVTTYFKSGLELTGRAFVTKQEDEDTQIGWLVQARHPVGDRTSLSIGYADAPEVINESVISTQSIFAGASFDVTDNLTFHANFNRADRENIHVRNDVSVGFTRKF